MNASGTKTQHAAAGHTVPPPFPQVHSRREQRLYRQVILASDLLVALAAFGLAAMVRAHLPLLHGTMDQATLLACVVLFLLTIFLARIDRAQAHWRTEASILLRAGVVAEFVLIAVLFLLHRAGSQVSRPILLFFGAFLIVGLASTHTAIDSWRERRRARAPHHLVLVGDPARCHRFAEKISSSLHWRILEIVSDRYPGDASGVVARLNRSIRDLAVDTVILSSAPSGAGPATLHLHQQVVQLCETTGTRLQIHADWLDEYANVYLDHIGTEAVLTYSFSPDLSWPLVGKRGIDIGLSIAILVAASPLMLLAALAIKLDSPGPVFFSQERNGFRGRVFKIYKFRSMICNAEGLKAGLLSSNEMTGPVFKMARDPRITRVGRWLRKTSLDELPQFLNVLRGEMSVVGPRPPLPSEVAQYGDRQLRRLSMKPGITGRWQVMGRNQITNFETWARMDAEYIRNWTLLADFKIIARTAAIVWKWNGR